MNDKSTPSFEEYKWFIRLQEVLDSVPESVRDNLGEVTKSVGARFGVYITGRSPKVYVYDRERLDTYKSSCCECGTFCENITLAGANVMTLEFPFKIEVGEE